MLAIRNSGHTIKNYHYQVLKLDTEGVIEHLLQRHKKSM